MIIEAARFFYRRGSIELLALIYVGYQAVAQYPDFVKGVRTLKDQLTGIYRDIFGKHGFKADVSVQTRMPDPKQ